MYKKLSEVVPGSVLDLLGKWGSGWENIIFEDWGSPCSHSVDDVLLIISVMPMVIVYIAN